MRNPDYHYRFGDKVLPGFYNRSIDTYDVLLDGKYAGTVQIPWETPIELAEDVAIARARLLYMDVAGADSSRVAVKLVCSIPPAGGKPEKMNADTRTVKKIMKQMGGKFLPEADAPGTVAGTVDGTAAGDIVAIRTLDGGCEVWPSMLEFGRKYMINKKRLLQCLDHNSRVIHSGSHRSQRLKMNANRYIFYGVDRPLVEGVGCQGKSHRLPAEEVAAALALEDAAYADRRRRKILKTKMRHAVNG